MNEKKKIASRGLNIPERKGDERLASRGSKHTTEEGVTHRTPKHYL